MKKILPVALVVVMMLTGCAVFAPDSESKKDTSQTTSMEKKSELGSDQWFLEEYIYDLECLLGPDTFDTQKTPLQDKLLLFAYLKLEHSGKVDKYYSEKDEAFKLPYDIISDTISQYFGEVDMRSLENYDSVKQVFTLGLQSFGSMSIPQIAEKQQLADNKIKLIVDSINYDLPEDDRVIRRRDYVFLKTQEGYILNSATQIFFKSVIPPE